MRFAAASICGGGSRRSTRVVNLVEELGSEAFVHCQLGGTANGAITATPDVIDARGAPNGGDAVQLHVKEDSMLLFGRESGARIGGS